MVALKIKNHKGKLVFRVGDLRIDQLSVHDILPTGRFPKELQVKLFRKRRLFDSGKILEMGTHGESWTFVGFGSTCPEIYPTQETMFGRSFQNIHASWFKKGDLLSVSRTSLQEVRRGALENWRSQVENRPEQKELVQLVSQRYRDLIDSFFNASKAKRFHLSKRDHQLVHRMISFISGEPLETAIDQALIPEIIYWQNPNQ
jgi:hypothetical protein